MSIISNDPTQKIRGNLAYQQRQHIRKSHLEKKQKLRRIFQLGKLIEQVGFETEDTAMIYGLLLEAKEKLQSKEAENLRMAWQMKGNTVL